MSSAGDAAVALARAWIGTPYRHQASCRGAGADCLGLVRGVWREFYGSESEATPAYTEDWSEGSAQERLWAAAQRHLIEIDPRGPHEAGQVLLFRMRDGAVAKHLGIATWRDGGPAFVHAYSGHGVVENALGPAWARRIVARFRFPEWTEV
jgi:NlpC/P60 family putative phage cell wall peptidase